MKATRTTSEHPQSASREDMQVINVYMCEKGKVSIHPNHTTNMRSIIMAIFTSTVRDMHAEACRKMYRFLIKLHNTGSSSVSQPET